MMKKVCVTTLFRLDTVSCVEFPLSTGAHYCSFKSIYILMVSGSGWEQTTHSFGQESESILTLYLQQWNYVVSIFIENYVASSLTKFNSFCIQYNYKSLQNLVTIIKFFPRHLSNYFKWWYYTCICKCMCSV